MMTRMLKFFMVALLITVSFPYRVCAEYDARDVQITVLKQKDKTTGYKPLKGIKLESVNIKDKNSGKFLSAITDKNGVATFKGLCYDKRVAGIKEIKIKVSDPDHYYSTKYVKVTDLCKYDLYLSPISEEEDQKYASAEMIQKYAVNREYKLKFYPVCNPNYTNYPSEVKRHCIEDFFDETTVQVLQGEELAQLYVFNKYDENKLIHCNTLNYAKRGKAHYLQCTSTDARDVFEFKFKNLNQSWANASIRGTEPIYKIQDSSADAICRMNEGDYNNFRFSMDASQVNKRSCVKYRARGSGQEIDESATKQFCPKIDKEAQVFGWRAGYVWNYEYGCFFDFLNKYLLDTYPGLDPTIFESTTVHSDEDMILLLNQYVRFKLNTEFQNLICAKGFSRYVRSGFKTDGHVVTCTLFTNDGGRHKIDFLFKNVAETDDIRANAGKSGMSCVASGGMFDGKNCYAIGKAQCGALANQLPGGAVWNEDLGMCVMKDAVKQQDIEEGKKVAKIAGGFVIGVIVTAASGGTAAPAVLAWVTFAVSQGAKVINAILEEIQNERAKDFIIAANVLCPSALKCSASSCRSVCNPDSICAKNVLVGAYGDIRDLVDHSNDPKTQLSKAVTQAHGMVLEKITKDCVDEDFVRNIKESVGLANAISVVSLVGTVADMIPTDGSLPFSSVVTLGNSAKSVSTIFIDSKNALDVMQRIFEIGRDIKAVYDDVDHYSNAIKASDAASVGKQLKKGVKDINEYFGEDVTGKTKGKKTKSRGYSGMW